MNKSFLASTLLSLLLLCIMTVDSKAASSENPLDEIAWLVGGTWVAESKTPEGSPVTTEAAFDWASHKKAILYSIVRKYENKTVPTLEGVCAWHPGKKQLVLLEVDNEGNLTESIVTVYGTKVSYEELIRQVVRHSLYVHKLPVKAKMLLYFQPPFHKKENGERCFWLGISV